MCCFPILLLLCDGDRTMAPSTLFTKANWSALPLVTGPQSAIKKKVYLALIEHANLQKASALHFTTHQELEEASLLGLTPPQLVIPHGSFTRAN